MLALTGQRRSEVAGMTWADVDLASALWTIPAARSKNGLEHRVPLSPQALQIIAALPRFGGGQGFLFSSGDTPPSGFSRAKRRLDDALAAMAKASGDDAMPPFALHDLRRTALSGMARLDVALPIIERVVNHIRRFHILTEAYPAFVK
ncbi:site-specific integrase [Methylocystis sp. ATCC 49242]|uniref:site-specific integrase n=1 Tax=Methylocystis sp. ATCC 49242 TaxID=622637 RepID=UPI0001F8738C|nr:site-specific integrase [Methylocystis sp. ATCC 49242]